MSDRWLMVGTTGGHLEELVRLSTRIVPAGDWVGWVTHADPQAQSLLRGRDMWTVPYVPPRGVAQATRSLPFAWRLLRTQQVTRVVSTGSGIALPFFVAAEARGVRGDYIESAARAAGPSLTGRILGDLPRIHLTTQYRSWAGGSWSYGGSVFDDYAVVPSAHGAIRKVVVTVGTMRTYGFPRLLRRLSVILPEVLSREAEVLWQTGCTDLRGLCLSGRVAPTLPNAQLKTAIAEADLVIAHAGVGSALAVLDSGKRPLLVPRRARHSEHVDDHQSLITEELGARGLAVSREADDITAQDLLDTAAVRVLTRRSTERFVLCN